jgi:hypothetical protein
MSTVPADLIIKFRDTMRAASPPWLFNGTAVRILFSLTVPLDAFGDGIVAAVKVRFPNVYTSESLGLIGRERRIRRGLVETDESYGTRLQRWFEDHKRRGGPYALLAQLFAHYAPDNFPIDLIYRSGARFQMAADGVVTRSVVALGDTDQWASWVLVYLTDAYDISDAVDLAVIPREWIAAHCLGELVVLPTGGELWNYPPEMLWNQTGTWDTADVSARIPIVSA